MRNPIKLPDSEVSQGYTSLNRIQSIVYPTAFGSNENMLVCGGVLACSLTKIVANAPMDYSSHRCRKRVAFCPSPLAERPSLQGKTDVAMLTILRVLEQNRTPSSHPNASIASTINLNAFKIVYV